MEEKYDHNEYVKQISENKNIEDPDSLFNLESSEINDVFVYSQFVKPGVQTVLIFDPLTNKIYYKQIGIHLRKNDHNPSSIKTEPSASHNTDTSHQIAARKQIFNDFKLDTAAVMKLCIILDTQPKMFKPYKYMSDL